MPQGNGFVLAVLRSRVHRMLSGIVVELRYTGRRSGREYVLPVQYAGSGRRLVVRPQLARRSNWWRNFRPPMPVTVRLAGRILPATARLVTPDDPEWEPARQLYGTRWRRTARRTTGPLVVLLVEEPTSGG